MSIKSTTVITGGGNNEGARQSPSLMFPGNSFNLEVYI